MKRSKRKRPSREEFMLNEQVKIEEGVFEKRTMLKIADLFTHGVISRLNFIIARGKEADIYLANAGSKIGESIVVVKIFRVETSLFDRRIDYIVGDPRFGKIKHSMRAIVEEWCKKEYINLKMAEEAGVHAPKPYMFSGNVLAMEFIGNDSVPAPTLKEALINNPNDILKEIIDDIRKLYKVGIVHADISEYNILVKDGIPYMIDFGQAVSVKHPKAEDLLKRDVFNIVSYFNKTYGLNADPSIELESVTNYSKE
ncbi:MAG: serine protein kinase RIO [Candidatus Micrarchaeaceae archaeon]